MRIAGPLWSALLALACAGCGEGTVCEEATDKLVGECELGGGATIDSLKECKDETKCRAECVLDEDCTDITDPESRSYNECIAECAAEN